MIRGKPAAGGAPGSGRTLIVKIKREYDRAHPVDGEKYNKIAFNCVFM